MRTETFFEEHPVKLTVEEQRLRAQQASRACPALAKQESAIDEKKKAQKAEIATMETDKSTIITTARTAALAAEKGEEPRQVECREELRGSTVYTIRLDTEETVRDRPATEPEIRGEQKRAEEAARARPKGYTPAEKAAKLAAGIATLCAKARAEQSLLKNLAKACPEATPAEVKDAVALAVREGRIDHVVPRQEFSRRDRRRDAPNNLVGACGGCNLDRPPGRPRALAALLRQPLALDRDRGRRRREQARAVQAAALAEGLGGTAFPFGACA